MSLRTPASLATTMVEKLDDGTDAPDPADGELARLATRHVAMWEQLQIDRRDREAKSVDELTWRMLAIEARIGRLYAERHRRLCGGGH